MAIVAPFKGMTYNYKSMEDLSVLVAPPYDVISKEEQDAFYQADPYNVIRLILPKKKTGDSDWDNRYTRAADYFKRWSASDIIIGSEHPCVYLTSHTYKPGDGSDEMTRWGIIAAVRIEEADSGVILPHEKTFSAHKDDRLKLMKACNAQLSQIFGLYEEPDNTILNNAKKFSDNEPEISFDFKDGSRHRMWILKDPDFHKDINRVIHDKKIFIADGHHRYETARNYRNMMRSRYGRKPAGRSYEFVVMYLTNMSDKGLTILPSHRLIKDAPNFDFALFMDKVKKYFNINEFDMPCVDMAEECAKLKSRLEQAGARGTSIAFYFRGSSKYYLFSIKPEARESMGDDLHPSLKKLDVMVLSRLVLQNGIGFSAAEMDDEERFHYQSSLEAAVSQIKSGNYEMAFLLNHTKIEHVKEIAGNSMVMPRKSTFFYPKTLSGLVFNKIDPHEIIQIP
jgi:uncharacterized protein (DUF1015 family)